MQNRGMVRWKSLVKSITSRYDSITKTVRISSSLDVLKVEDVKEDGDDYNEAHSKSYLENKLEGSYKMIIRQRQYEKGRF